MVIISVANNKGGVGKTTTTLHIGAALAERKLRVLLVDMDPQSSLTLYLGYDPTALEYTSYHVMTRRVKAQQAVIMTKYPFLDLLPASIELAAAELEISGMMGREFLLRDQLSALSDLYDVVLIDNMPSLGILTVNSLMASDWVIVPIEPSYLAYKGLEMISTTIREVQRYQPGLKLLGAVITMVDERTRHGKEIIARIRENYPVLEPPIRRSVKFADAAMTGDIVSEAAGDRFEGTRGYRKVAEAVCDALGLGGSPVYPEEP